MNEYKGKSVLVTGGAGFVGCNLVRKLVELGAAVTVFDDLFTGFMSNLNAVFDRIEFIKGDVRNENLVKQVIYNGEFDYVFHLAARNIIISTKNPMDDFSVNIGGTLNLLNCVKDSKRLKKFVYASSVSIYGNKTHPITEEDSVNLLSPYAVSKLGGENYSEIFYEVYNVPTTVVRYSNVYGDFQTTENMYCGVIGKIVDAIKNDKRPHINGDGQQTRDYTFIEDAVEATLIAGASEKSIGEKFNIGTGVEISLLQIVSIVNEILGKDMIPEFFDYRDIDSIRRRCVDPEKIRRALRWSSKVNIREGIKKTIEWYEKNV
jgi:UDP-glucose 4-epimerase